MHCLHYVAKLKQIWVFFYSFITQREDEANKYCVFLYHVNKFFLCVQYVFKKTVV